MRTFAILTASTLIAAGAFGAADAKRALTHDDFDGWKWATNNAMSHNGEWMAYTVAPQEGDGVLTLHNTVTGRDILIERGYRPAFTADGRWAVTLVKPHFADTRKAKIDKKKDFDLPQDSLAIIDLKRGTVERVANVISYRIGKEGGDWVAYQSCDTTLISAKSLADKEAGRPLVVRSLTSAKSKTINWTGDYTFSKDGRRLAFNLRKSDKDSLATNGVGLVSLPDTSLYLIDRDRKRYGIPVFNEAGTHLAYTATCDSAKTGTPRYALFLSDLSTENFDPEEIPVKFGTLPSMNLSLPHAADPAEQAKLEEEWRRSRREQGEELTLNQYTFPLFSHDGRRLVAGIAPYVAPDDTTLVDFETASLDIWRWDAPMTPPQEQINIKKLREHTMPVVIDLATMRQETPTRNPLAKVEAPDRWDADWALVLDPTADITSSQWDYFAPVEASLFNVSTGDIKKIGMIASEEITLSPEGRYVTWFEDRAWHVYDIAGGTTRDVSADIPYPMWDETDDHPWPKPAYGMAGWSEGDRDLLIYDRHDIWSVDPKGARKPVCLTAGAGRKSDLRYRYRKLDPEQRAVKNGEEMVLDVFSYADKRQGLATMKFGKATAPADRVLNGYSFTQMLKAKDAPVFSWTQGNFSVIPEVEVCRGYGFGNAKKLTDLTAQTAEVSWGKAELFSWYAYDGTPSQGVVYLPEDFDPAKSYPMLSVFYETGSEELYRHYRMEPSWSWVNYPFYVSRGYVVFVPDIHYTPGIPGENAYNFVCSGVDAVCKKYPNIDRKRIGIDGQSWGGYQTAYLVTRTDMFACAGSGAPVSNMTSAFGGIRWESGSSRQAQYEQGQSRIGRNLWESPELYIHNSPVFHADRVKTPLLIMHNDADGAVPWYQGIEMFMALRRLQKPVWMLQYNSEAHNLKERRNRKDITIRLQQFFDHYLKGDPMPKWMKQGIPPLRKGQEFGTELTEDLNTEK